MTEKTSTAANNPRAYIPRGQMKHLTRETILEEMGPSKLAALTLILALGLIFGATAWSFVIPVTTSTTSLGEVVPSGNQQVVQHLEGGIVRDILVDDGDQVTVGQPLIIFEPTQRRAELDQIRAREAALRIREIRLRAQIDDAEPDFGDLESRYPILVEEAKINFIGTRERLAGQRLVIQSKIEQRQKTVEIYNKQARSLRKQIVLLTEAVEMREKLFASGHGSRVNVISSRLELSRVEGAFSEAEASAEQAEVSIQEARNELNEVIVTERDEALEALSGVLGELAEVTENLTRLQDRVDRLNVVSPVNGLIHGMTVNTIGAVIEPAAVLMTIIPAGEPLVVESKIEPKDIGHVAIGQFTKVSVSGFDQRRYGIVLGELVKLSPTTLTDEEGNPYFKGQIELAATTLKTGAKETPIVPGMTVTADIVTGQQTLLQYLTGPVYDALSKSFSER